CAVADWAVDRDCAWKPKSPRADFGWLRRIGDRPGPRWIRSGHGDRLHRGWGAVPCHRGSAVLAPIGHRSLGAHEHRFSSCPRGPRRAQWRSRRPVCPKHSLRQRADVSSSRVSRAALAGSDRGRFVGAMGASLSQLRPLSSTCLLRLATLLFQRTGLDCAYGIERLSATLHLDDLSIWPDDERSPLGVGDLRRLDVIQLDDLAVWIGNENERSFDLFFELGERLAVVHGDRQNLRPCLLYVRVPVPVRRDLLRSTRCKSLGKERDD